MAKKTKKTTPQIDLTGYYDNPEVGAIRQQQPSAGPQQYGDLIYGQQIIPNPISAEFAQTVAYDERTPQRTLLDELQSRPPDTLKADDRTKGQLRRDRLTEGFRRKVPESFRTLLPGFSDVEDALYLREALQSGNAGQIALAGAGFALPFVGSKVLKGAAKKLGKKAGKRGPEFDLPDDDILPFEGGEIVEPRPISRTERKITRQAEHQATKRKNYAQNFANKSQKQSEFSKVISGKRDGNFAVSELGEDFNVRKAYLDPLDKKAGTDVTVYRSGGKGETTGGIDDTVLGFKLTENKKGVPVVSDMIFTREQSKQGILDAGRMAQMFESSTPQGAIFKPGSLSTDSFPLYLNTLAKRNRKTPGKYVVQAEEVNEWFTPNNLGKYTDEIYETPSKQVDFLNSKVDEFNATLSEGGTKVPPVKLNKQGRVVIPDIVVKKMLPAMLGIGLFGASKVAGAQEQEQTFQGGGQLPEDNLRARSDSLTAANSNLPWIQRYQQGNELSIPDPYNPGSGKTSTHGLAYHPFSQDSATIYPEIVQQGDSLVHRTGDAAREYAEQNNLGIDTDLELAKYYSQDGLIQHRKGGQLMSKSGIKIKPSKRGTFTAAATKHGKTVQGFASQVMRNPDNYTPAMVKKANFARNAAKWKKELGGYLDQELNNPIIEDTPIDSAVVPKTQFGCGGKLRHYQDGGQVSFDPPIMVPLTAGQIGDIKGGGAEGGGIGEGIEGGFGGGFGTEFPEAGGGSEFGPEPSLQRLIESNPAAPNITPQTTLPIPAFQNGGYLGLSASEKKKFDAAAKAMGHTREQHAAHIFQNGGRLPEYGVGGWLGTIGSVASIIPVVGQIAGPILKTAGAIAGKFEEKAAAEKAQKLQKAETQFAASQEAEVLEDQALEGEVVPPEEVEYQFGGSLTQGNFQNPVINKYDGNANNHQQGPGGIPVDAKGTPSAVSRQSAVGLTEKGEVTWNGYVFSDKLTT